MTFENRLYGVGETAKILACTQRTIHNYIDGNQLKAIKRGNRLFIEGEELARFMKDGLEKGYWRKLIKKDKEG